MADDRYEQAIRKIDAANAEDPNLLEIDGRKLPRELVHAERRTAWVRNLTRDRASEALLLAARAQHIRRWEIPRDSYPKNRPGYLQWRRELKWFHAEKTAQILTDVGYGETRINRVRDLILKKRLNLDPEVQTLEDALCLVFLEEQFSDFARKEEDKIGNIVRKTWRKMSSKGRQATLGLPMTDEDRAIIQRALVDHP